MTIGNLFEENVILHLRFEFLFINSENTVKNFIVLSLFLFLATSIHAQTLDEVLAKYYKAIGQEKLVKVNTMLSKGKLSQMGQNLPFKMTYARPLKLRFEVTFQGLTMIQAFDGVKGWSTNPFMGDGEPAEIPADQLKNLKVQADMDGALWDYKAKGYTAELLPNEKVEGVECFVIELKDAEKDSYKIYLDKESFMILKQTSKTVMGGQPVEMEIYPSNYKDIDGMKIAFDIEVKAEGQTIYKMALDSNEIDPKVDDKIFVMPK